jgi:hypothetical protein
MVFEPTSKLCLPIVDPMLNPSEVELGCVTFGAPPLFNTDVTTLIRTFHSDAIPRGLELAFVNEGDPIPRLDTAYSKVLALLYHKANSDDYGSVVLSLERLGLNITGKNTFNLSSLSLFRLGEMIMFADSREDQEEEGLDLRLYQLKDKTLDQGLWADLPAHKMAVYNTHASELAAGRFNGRSGWHIELARDPGLEA